MNTWAPFWLSLAVPGAGQLLARSWTAIVWFFLAAVAAALFALVSQNVASDAGRVLLTIFQAGSLLALGLASGLHARRLVMPRTSQRRLSARSQVHCPAMRRKSVRLSIAVGTSRTPAELWRVISNLEQFLTIDPFHERVTLMRRVPAAGVHLVLDHNVCGVRLRRFGKILSWREGEGYAISDLSRRGRRVGFPHRFAFRIEPVSSPAGECTSVLHVEIRGKWTSPVIPAWLGRWWLVVVCRAHARLLEQSL